MLEVENDQPQNLRPEYTQAWGKFRSVSNFVAWVKLKAFWWQTKFNVIFATLPLMPISLVCNSLLITLRWLWWKEFGLFWKCAGGLLLQIYQESETVRSWIDNKWSHHISTQGISSRSALHGAHQCSFRSPRKDVEGSDERQLWMSVLWHKGQKQLFAMCPLPSGLHLISAFISNKLYKCTVCHAVKTIPSDRPLCILGDHFRIILNILNKGRKTLSLMKSISLVLSWS